MGDWALPGVAIVVLVIVGVVLVGLDDILMVVLRRGKDTIPDPGNSPLIENVESRRGRLTRHARRIWHRVKLPRSGQRITEAASAAQERRRNNVQDHSRSRHRKRHR